MPPVGLPTPARLTLFLAVLLASTAVVLSVGSPKASAAKPCWEQVIDDWTDNGRIDLSYSTSCLQASLSHVPEDVRAYSDFEEKVRQAIQATLRERRLQQVSGEAPTTSQAQRNQVEQIEEEERTPAREPDDKGPIRDALGYGTTDASSVPLPLIILAALALVLLSAGAAAVAHRKLAARRVRSR